MNLDLIMNQMMVLFILLFVGFSIRKKGIVSKNIEKGLSDLMIYITLPALIITSMSYKFSKSMFNNSLLILLIGFFLYIFMVLVSIAFIKGFHTKDPYKRGVYQFIVIFGNVGFMGYPLVQVIFGDIGVFYAAVYNFWFNLLMWTLGVVLVKPEAEGKIELKTLMNPGVIAIVLGFLLFVFSIKLPKPIYQSLEMLGAMTTPIAMIVVGSMLTEANFSMIFKNKTLLFASITRLIIIPVFIILALYFIELPFVIKGVLILVSSMPTAANAAIFSRKFNSDYRLASQGVFLTTLMGIVTIPLIVYLLTLFQY
ncbi:AEC family transporter [Clostridiisalibacter paucivorans]|uniref:AEC family transporter n=1 Tax=Clostridiisalibacter paucivorans TaxID=408753 RepID=UPI0004798543|nr:AEC family transporter [Clostridiisalibacter paucivorans]